MMSEEVEVLENREPGVEDSSGVADGNPPTTEDVPEASGVQLEPTKNEMERERLYSRAEQLQDDIARLHNELVEKEMELSAIKKQLGITAFTEFKDSMAHGWKVMGDKWKEVQETETFKKIDSTLTGWKEKVEGSGSYQKTVSTLNEGGKKVSSGLSTAGTKIRESETLKSVGEKTSSALKRTGTAIKDTGTAIKESETLKNVGSKISGAAVSFKERVWSSTDQGNEGISNGDTTTKGETLIPDEPTKE